ncbi:MAG TPA: ethylbenzene dehydrogenase-related protein, partial [Dehalococcoidia bacterium]|nr:ethylbenzene dehydrogenase-related protein [Dehalococcoidia bacterium]
IWQWKGDWQGDIDRGFVNVPNAYPNVASDLYPFQKEDTFYPGRAAGNLISQPDRKSPVEDLVAAGFGTLTTAEVQKVQGNGVWQDGKWYVVFTRDMDLGGGFYVPLKGGQTTNVAFAVWDGAKGERDGLKSVSQFAELRIEGKDETGANVISLVALGLLAAVGVAGFAYLIYKERLKRGA